jgi:DNA-binding transcriptional MerR regulator
MSLGAVAALLKVKPYRVEYLLANGLVPEPEMRVSGRRVFAVDDVRRLAAHFKITLPSVEPTAEPTAEAAGV